jgi:hypothetical protein
MWTSPEDARRYRELTGILQTLLAEDAVLRGEQRVAPEDLALYLEWLELAREASSSACPCVDNSSPFVLAMLSYREMEGDFRWLSDQLARAVGWSDGVCGLE